MLITDLINVEVRMLALKEVYPDAYYVSTDNDEALYYVHDPRSAQAGVYENLGQTVIDGVGNLLDINVDLVKAAYDNILPVWDAQEYARLRKQEYPTIEECVHAILDDELVALQEKRMDIKARYPK